MRRRQWGIVQSMMLLASASLASWAFRKRRIFDLGGKVVLVTGGSRGLGLYIARALGRAGARVAVCARNEEELEQAERDLASRGVEVLAVRCDVSVRQEVERLVDAVMNHFGAIDAVINNASILDVGPLESMMHADFEAALAVNFWGVVNTSMAVLPIMRRKGAGRIVNVTSIGGKVAVPHLLAYDAAKFAAVGFSEGLAAEVAKDGIIVTTVVPGLMRTGSPVHVSFHGAPEREYLWFTLCDVTPLTAMDAARAADQIVRALERGKFEVTLSWQAKLLRTFHALSPTLTIRVLALLARALPLARGSERQRMGHELSLPNPIARLLRPLVDQSRQLVPEP
jgi:NAD(P)-dependent dehydrogenase (short-subunit alcohol dehydrogenase family)